MKKFYLSILLAGMLTPALLLFPSSVFSAVIYVNHSAAGANNGSSWADAFTDLQNALQSASPGDEIWVAQGVYYPSVVIDLNGDGGIDSREAVFFLPDGIALYGGFTGSEGALSERNWETNLTILSGDIDHNDLNADGNFIAETTAHITGNNSYHVMYTENAGPSARLDGFVITAGSADIAVPTGFNDPNLDGGGWYNRMSAPSWSSGPSIVNTSFFGNYSESEGGAFYSGGAPAGSESSPLFDKCLFSGNKSNNAGGAIFIGSFSPGNYNPQILNSRFIGNEAYRRGGAIALIGDNAIFTSSHFEDNAVTVISPDMSTLPGSGGAVSLVASNAVFTSCMFFSNSATGNPTGAFEGGGGGAVYASTNDPQTASLGASVPRFVACGFYNNSAGGNTAAWGGAMVYLNDGGILKPQFVNCVFSGNQAQNHGGAIAGFTRVLNDPAGFTPLLEPEFTNCTFYGNQAGQTGGAIYHSGYMYDGSQVLESAIVNSILWGNSAVAGSNEIYTTGNMAISYSLISGSGGSGGGWNASLGTDGGNNIDDNPNFVNEANPLGADNIPATGDDGLRLTQFSPAVNAGNNMASGLTGITTDYTGAPRVFSSVVDMGAYERAGIILPDFDLVWILDWHGFHAPCLTCPPPWSFLLFRDFGFEPEFVWKEPARFIRKGNSATIEGEIVNLYAPEVTFRVYMKLEREHNWKRWSRQQGSWFSKTAESEAVANSEHVNWKFWRLSTRSFLKGTGEVEGTLQIKQWSSSQKTGFQMGIGANAWDADFGIAGYFTYNGKLTYKGKRSQVKGLGSFNADADPCQEENCEELFMLPASGMGHSHKSATLPGNDSESGFKIYPVPAGEVLMLESSFAAEGFSSVRILDATGRVVVTDTWDRSQPSHSVRLDKLNSGLHILQVISGNTDGPYIRRFIKK
jgi:predicted outer membrane repeat protein